MAEKSTGQQTGGEPTPLPWHPTFERFVAFLDIMGFKNWVQRGNHDAIITTMLQLVAINDVLNDLAKTQLQPTKASAGGPDWQFPYRAAVKTVLFSDSMLLVTNDGSYDSARALFMTTQAVIWRAALHGIPMKGAIAYGKQTAEFDLSLHVGIPLIDAFELQDDLLMYGAVLHHSAERHLTSSGWMNELRHTWLHNYTTPVRSGSVNHYVLDCWHSGTEEPQSQRSLDGILEQFYLSVSGSTRRYVDNTAKFCSWLKEEHGRLRSGDHGGDQAKGAGPQA